jgi:hypothetical protein
MILVLCAGSMSLKSLVGSDGMGSPQYGQVSLSGVTGMPHVWQVSASSLALFLFTGLGLKHMIVSFPSSTRSSEFSTGTADTTYLPLLYDYTDTVPFSFHFSPSVKITAR